MLIKANPSITIAGASDVQIFMIDIDIFDDRVAIRFFDNNQIQIGNVIEIDRVSFERIARETRKQWK